MSSQPPCPALDKGSVARAIAISRMSAHDCQMLKSERLLFNIAVDLDGHPFSPGPLTPIDIVALRAAIAALVLTAVLILSTAVVA